MSRTKCGCNHIAQPDRTSRDRRNLRTSLRGPPKATTPATHFGRERQAMPIVVAHDGPSSFVRLLLLLAAVDQILAGGPPSPPFSVPPDKSEARNSLSFRWRHGQLLLRVTGELRGGGCGGENGTDWQDLFVNLDRIDRFDLDVTIRNQPRIVPFFPHPKRAPCSSYALRASIGRDNDWERHQLGCRDMLQCRSPPRLWPDEVDLGTAYDALGWRGGAGADWFGATADDFDDDFSSYSDSSSFSAPSNGPAGNGKRMLGSLGGKGRVNQKRRRLHSPVVYQFYGRSRSRGPPSPDAPHFLLLGPNVDHWKSVGQILASRGFNVMACERIVEDDDAANAATGKVDKNPRRRPQQDSVDGPNDAPDLVLDLLDLLKWNKAVLVGCDTESKLAMETAMILAPDRVCGLILCGDLTDANRLAVEAGGVNVLDTFLHRILDCPFVIVWDGDGTPSVVSGSSARAAVETDIARCVILGGGSSPHRTKPEQFAWVLTRFVEEKLEYHPMRNVGDDQHEGVPGYVSSPPRQNLGGIIQNLNLPFAIDSLVSPEGRLLLGQAVAAAIFYASIMKVLIVQYGLLRAGLISVKTSVDSVDALRRKLFHAVAAFVWNFGYLPRLFKFSLKKTREVDEDYIDSRKTGGGETVEDEELKGGEPPKADTDDEGDFPPPPGSKSRDIDTDTTIDDPLDQEDRPRFKPFFFLDNVIT